MRDVLLRIWTDFGGRIDGPMRFRLVLQPSIAMILAVRAGIRDARMGHAPYLWAVFSGARGRGDLLREGWGDVGRVFVVAVAMDALYQAIVLHWFYLGEAVAIAAILALVPYILVRGSTTRIVRRAAAPRE